LKQERVEKGGRERSRKRKEMGKKRIEDLGEWEGRSREG